MTREIYISTDVETKGPIPGEYSMLSLGSIAIDKKRKILGEFYKKRKPLPKAKQHSETMRLWKKNLEAWKEATSDPKDPEVVIKEYIKWCFKFWSDFEKQRSVFIAWSATFDFMFVYWYIIRSTKQCEEEFLKYAPFAIAGLDIRTYAMSALKQNYLNTNSLPKKWTENTGEHTRRAIDDAKQNALILINMLKENSK